MTDESRNDAEVSDATLVDRARSGDDTAFDGLVRRHSAAAFRVALSITRNEALAQDVVQDAFIKAFRGLDGFRGDSAFRTWLMTITANEARGALRRRGRQVMVGLEETAQVASDEPDPAHRTVRASEASRARSALAELPEKQRLSVSLRIDEGLSFREIGDLIGSSEGAARVNYFHGIRRLRELLQ